MRTAFMLVPLLILGCGSAKTAEEVGTETLNKMTRSVTPINPNQPLPKFPQRSEGEPNVSVVSEKSAGIRDLVIEDLVKGSGKEAVDGSYCTVHYVGTLPDGFVFDTSYGSQTGPFEFQIAPDAPVIEGWKIGVKGMRVGGKRRLTIPAKLAYGSDSPTSKIPPNSALIFEIDLLFVRDRP